MHRRSNYKPTDQKEKKEATSKKKKKKKKKKKTMMMCSDDNLSNQQCPQVIMMKKKKDKRLVSTSSTAIATPNNNEVEQKQKQNGKGGLKCPRCNSSNTKFCYYNNYSLSQPRHFCKSCKRYWTLGGSLRNVPVGGSSRKKNKPLKPLHRHHLSSPPPPLPLPPLPNPLLFTTDHMITNSLNNINYLVSLPSFPYSSIDIEQLPNIGLVHSTSTADHLNYFSSFNHDNNFHQALLPLDYHVLPCDNIINNVNLTSDHALHLNSGSDLFL